MLHALLQPLRDLLHRLFGKRAKPAPKGKPAARPAPAKAKPAKKRPDGPAPQEFAFSLKTPPKPDPAKPQAKAQPKPMARPKPPEDEDGEAPDPDLEIKSGSEKKEKRTAFRVPIRGLDIACAELNARCPALDISATGIGFQYQGPRVKGGTVLTLDVRLAGTVLAQQIPVKVMRHEGGVLGCAFLEMTRPQEEAVGKIVVGAQRGTLFPAAGAKTPPGKPGAKPGAPAKPQAAPARPQQPPQAKPGAAPAKPGPAKPAAPGTRPVSPPGATRK